MAGVRAAAGDVLPVPAPGRYLLRFRGRGHCAAVFFRPYEALPVVAHAHIPPLVSEMAEVASGIFEYELIAVALAVAIALGRFPGRPLVAGCDNQGALGAIKRGSGKTGIVRAATSFIW